ncbi:MAG: pilus assembly protein [Pseudomonas sp.]
MIWDNRRPAAVSNMRKLVSISFSLILSMLLWSGVARADDIDLYAGISPSAGDPPTVLLIWDNAANTSASASNLCTYSDGSGAPSLGASTVSGMEQCALVNALLAIGSQEELLGRIKVGLMVFNKNGFSNNGNGQCGYLQYAPQLMDAAHITELATQIKGFTGNGSGSIKTNGIAAGTTMAEAWAMLNSKSTSCSGVNYSTLAEVATQCRDAVIIYIGNAFTNSNPGDGTGGADTLLKSELSSVFNYSSGSNAYTVFTKPIAVAGLNTSGNTNNSYWADEWARFMKRVDVTDSTPADRNITTYTVSVTDFANQAQAQSVINYYAEMAKQGAGKPFLVDLNSSSSLVDALMTIFNEVQSVNSVFASATLPVSANTQGTYLNQVYIAMFRPDGSAAPRWFGNVKQYQLGLDVGGNIVLTDSQQNPNTGTVTSKTNPATGALSPEAISFWTTNTPGVTGWPSTGFWANSPAGDALQFDSPDGDLVEKGGAAQMSRVQNLTATYADSSNDNGRKLVTCNSVGGCGTTLASFDTANSTLTSNASSLFGVSSAASYTGVAMTAAGIGFVSSAAGSCVLPNSGPETATCTITIPYSGTPALAVGDKVFNDLSSGAVCPMPSGCSVTAATATSFTYEFRAPKGNTYTVNSATQFYKAASSVTGSLSDHGFAVGDRVTLTACTDQTDSATVSGLSALPAGTAQYSATIVSKTDNTFTFAWATPALTTANTVACTVKPALTASNLINWVRGWDIAGNEVEAGPCALVNGVPASADCPVTVRPSLHGDVLHSRPAVVNYGGSIGVVVFYGANDGVFHAVNGNQTAAIGTGADAVRAGGELWGFIAPEFFGKFKRLFQNTPLVSIAGVQDAAAQPKDYFFDGSTTVLRDTRTGTSTAGKTYLYLSARRGGRMIYALDVSDPTNPRYLWSVSNSNIPELGQTWSQPKVARLRGRANPVLVFGAGYAPEQDADPVVDPDSMGRGVLILDAVTGELVWAAVPSCSGLTLAADGACVATAALTHSVAADITLLDRNSDGNIDRLYAADVGGNIWRIDLEPNGYSTTPAPGDWAITKLAALGGTGNNARKFLFAPDVIPTNSFDAVMAVSGDREHPLYTTGTDPALAYNVVNRIYMIEDKHTGPAISAGFTALTEADLVDNTSPKCLNADLQPVSCTFNSATGEYLDGGGNVVSKIQYDGQAPDVNGFFITLRGVGEKGVNAPVSVAGKTYFGTNKPIIPVAGACSGDLGEARAYTVSFSTADISSNLFVGGGLPPSPVVGLVTIGNNTVPFIIGGAGPTPFDPSTPTIELSNNRKRAFWYSK